MASRKSIILFVGILSFIIHQEGWSQNLQDSMYHLKIMYQEKNLMNDGFSDTKYYGYIDSVKIKANKFIVELQNEGYLSASLDSFSIKNDSCYAHVFRGAFYKMKKLDWPKEIEPLLSIDLLDKLDQIPQLNNNSPAYFRNAILAELNEIGYINCEVRIDPEFISKTEYNGNVVIFLGEQVLMNEIILPGDFLVKKSFLYHYLFWEKGKPFQGKIFNGIDRRINNLSFVDLSSPAQLGIEYNLANLELRLKRTKSNIFDFVLGVLPTPSSQERSILFSVYLNAELNNILKNGEKLSIRFINTKPETQELNLSFKYPYIFSWPFGIEVGMQLYRNENTHLDLKYNLGVIWTSERDFKFSVYWERNSSSILNPDTTFLIEKNRLPEELDFITNKFVLKSVWEKLDHILYPRKGVRALIGFGIGQKEILINQKLSEIELSTGAVKALYDSLGLSNLQFEFIYKLDGYVPLSERWSIALLTSGKYLVGGDDQSFLQNELYRIGGNQLMRGFDEQFFLVNGYNVLTGELRFFLDRESYFSAFIDVGYLNRNTFEESSSGWVNGLGLGMNFQTGVGVFNLSYALGSGMDIPFDFNTGKIHFGYVSLF